MWLPSELTWEILLLTLVVGILVGSTVMALVRALLRQLARLLAMNIYFRTRRRLKPNTPAPRDKSYD